MKHVVSAMVLIVGVIHLLPLPGHASLSQEPGRRSDNVLSSPQPGGFRLPQLHDQPDTFHGGGLHRVGRA